MKKNDSRHEDYFEWWLDEAESNGFILRWERNTAEFPLIPKATIPYTKILKTKTVVVDKHLFHPHVYKPDYIIHWGYSDWLHNDINCLSNESKEVPFLSQRLPMYKNSISVIDVKPDKVNGRHQPTARTFPINQKFMWDVHGIYVNKIVLYPASNSASAKTLFQQTWTPQRYQDQEVYKTSRVGAKGSSKIKWKPVKTVDEFLHSWSKVVN